MPEGPSILITREAISPLLQGKKIIKAWGNAKFDKEPLIGQKITDIRTWGKQLFICFPKLTIRIHFLMFGTYSIDKHIRPDRSLRLAISTSKHTIYFYTSSVKIFTDDLQTSYDWNADVLSEKWDPAGAKKKLKELPGTLVCDALLSQEIFSGVGNIIKNEVLYRIKLHPETKVGKLPAKKLAEIIKEARDYSFDFLKWKKEFTLKKHWLCHNQKTCRRCDLPFTRKYCGVTERRTFFCTNCQVKYPVKP